MGINIRYSGYYEAVSGMGQACRNIVYALHAAGIGVSTELAPNLMSKTTLGKAHLLCQELRDKDIDYDIKIIHITPDQVRKHMEPLKYHIFHLFWETDKIPEWWKWELNHSVDEIWTGSEWNKKVFLDSGVKKPIWVCPQPVPHEEEDYKPFLLPGFKGFVFGSIFQWIERKDPKTLIRAFLKEFKGSKDVTLLLKTYKETFSQEETSEIMQEIKTIRKELGITQYPRIALYPHILTKHDIGRLYETMDCVVSAHRGEGFGIPIGEAMLSGKPVISTDLGGIHEHVPKELWYPVSYTMCPVFNMSFVPWYDDDQNWGQADEDHLRKQMRLVYDNREEAKNRGQRAKEYILNNLNPEAVGNRMLKRLEEIKL